MKIADESPRLWTASEISDRLLETMPERDQIILQAKSYSVVLDAKWRFGTVLFTAYIRH